MNHTTLQSPYELEVGQALLYHPPSPPVHNSDGAINPPKTIRYTIERRLSTEESYGRSYLARDDGGQRVFIKTPKVASGVPDAEVYGQFGEVYSAFQAAMRNSHLIKD